MIENHSDQPLYRGAAKDWAWDWTEWLPEGDTIASQELAVSDGLTAGTPVAAAGVVTATLTCSADAPVGSRQRATCTVTTAGGLTDSRAIRFVVVGR